MTGATIPATLSLLTNLRTLQLGGNGLGGTIPAALTALTNLLVGLKGLRCTASEWTLPCICGSQVSPGVCVRRRSSSSATTTSSARYRTVSGQCAAALLPGCSHKYVGAMACPGGVMEGWRGHAGP